MKKPVEYNPVARFLLLPLLIILLVFFPGCSPKTSSPPEKPREISHDNDFYFQGRADLQNTGCYPYPGPEKPELSWTFEADARIRGGCGVTRDGLIVFGVLSDNLFILDPKGKLKASTNPGSWVFSTPVIGPGNQIYVSCDDGRVHCMDATGKILWTYRLSAESSSTPALCNGHLYLGAEDDGLHCLTDTGKHRWKYNTRGRILFSSPGLDSQGNIYIGDENNILHAVNPDGTPRWQFEAGSEISTTSPIITDNGVIIPAGPDITALDVQGKILWQKTLHEEVTGNPCLSPQGDLMAVPVLDGVLVIMDVKDGKVTAKAKVAGNLQASAVADSQGRIYIVGDKGPIVAGWDGRILHKALLEKGGPFRGDPVITPKGQLIFGGMDGILYCFE